jgi:hypothetical protein
VFFRGLKYLKTRLSTLQSQAHNLKAKAVRASYAMSGNLLASLAQDVSRNICSVMMETATLKNTVI